MKIDVSKKTEQTGSALSADALCCTNRPQIAVPYSPIV